MKSQIVQARSAWWQEHVGRWRQSGMSKSGYCATHGLSLNSKPGPEAAASAPGTCSMSCACAPDDPILSA